MINVREKYMQALNLATVE